MYFKLYYYTIVILPLYYLFQIRQLKYFGKKKFSIAEYIFLLKTCHLRMLITSLPKKGRDIPQANQVN